jgi:predicted small lipoprotein YifL
VKSPGKKTILLLLAALVVLAIAGCGGGGDETTDSTAATTTEEPEKLSKAELIEQGDGICAETNAAVGALSSEIEASSLPETAEKTSNLYIGMVERLQELGAPEGAESGFTSFMGAAEEFAKVEGEIKLAIEREDSEALSEASNEATPALEEFETQAEAYGFKECSEGPQATLTGPGSSGEEAESGEVPEGLEEEGGVEPEAEYVEPEYEEEAPPVEEAAPETGGAGGGAEAAPESGGGESGGGSESGGVGPG